NHWPADHRLGTWRERRRTDRGRWAGTRIDDDFGGGHLDRQVTRLPERLPSGERSAGRLQNMDQLGRDYRRVARRADPRGLRGSARRLSRLHRHPRLEEGDAMTRLTILAALALLFGAAPASAQSWEVSG